jgi:hypothetical protein
MKVLLSGVGKFANNVQNLQCTSVNNVDVLCQLKPESAVPTAHSKNGQQNIKKEINVY